jgi:hypothetical protein
MFRPQHRLSIATAGTPPFLHWIDQLIIVRERYATIMVNTLGP